MLHFQKHIILVPTLLMIARCYEAELAFSVQKSTLKMNYSYSHSKGSVVLDLASKYQFKKFTLTIPKKCEEIGICEHVPNYPQQMVMRIIRKLLKQNITFNKDVEQWEDYADYFEVSSSIREDEDLCKSKPKTYFPQAARDVSKRWHLILNSARTPQNFIGEHCEPEHPDCSKMAYFSNLFYHGVCVQKYMKRVMYGLNDQMHGVVKTLFDVPSCCTCVARRTS